MRRGTKKQSGFTLVELAVVMVIIGIALTMGMKLLSATMNNAAFSETKAKQQQIKMALIGYLRTNGKLPCPDTAAGIPTGNSSACAGSAANSYGVVPWITLQIPREAVLDGWGDFFTYKVANGTSSKNWTDKTSNSSFSINELKVPTNALTVRELNTDGTALNDVTATAVVVLISHGKNGFGAKTSNSATRIPIDEAGIDEKTNADNTTTTFILRPVNDNTAAFHGSYDDLVTYMSPQDLIQPLVNEGTVKACTAYCPPLTSSCSVATQTCSCPSGTELGATGTHVTCPSTATCGACTLSSPSSSCTTNVTIPIGFSPVICS